MCVEERWYFHLLTPVISLWTYHLIQPLIWLWAILNQVRTNDARNVVLFVVEPSSIHHYIFWSDQCYHRVHMMVEVQ